MIEKEKSCLNQQQYFKYSSLPAGKAGNTIKFLELIDYIHMVNYIGEPGFDKHLVESVIYSGGSRIFLRHAHKEVGTAAFVQFHLFQNHGGRHHEVSPFGICRYPHDRGGPFLHKTLIS